MFTTDGAPSSLDFWKGHYQKLQTHHSKALVRHKKVFIFYCNWKQYDNYFLQETVWPPTQTVFTWNRIVGFQLALVLSHLSCLCPEDLDIVSIQKTKQINKITRNWNQWKSQISSISSFVIAFICCFQKVFALKTCTCLQCPAKIAFFLTCVVWYSFSESLLCKTSERIWTLLLILTVNNALNQQSPLD